MFILQNIVISNEAKRNEESPVYRTGLFNFALYHRALKQEQNS